VFADGMCLQGHLRKFAPNFVFESGSRETVLTACLLRQVKNLLKVQICSDTRIHQRQSRE